MKRLTMAAAVAFGVVGAAVPAHAVLQISGTVGGIAVQCADQNFSCDTNPLLGQLSVGDSTLNGVQFIGSSQTQTIGPPTNRLDSSSFQIINNSGSTQNIQLAVTAVGLTSAWLSGGGEDTTNRDLAALLGYPDCMRAVGTIPVGVPEKDLASRYRRPLDAMVHWNGYEVDKFRPDAMVDYYVSDVRQFAMYRGEEDAADWDDAEKRLGPWRAAFTGR